MIMEQVGITYATQRLAVEREQIFVAAIQVEYLSAGKQGPVDIYCELLGEHPSIEVLPNENEKEKVVHVKVCIKLQKNGLTSSEGILRLSIR
mmetsp:Transcript_22225/g.63595  ORF Transcript_22225/g.63595 Transcript_22225/m.63595 type:complete len:92 (-) Transcript_22225:58-333(-)